LTTIFAWKTDDDEMEMENNMTDDDYDEDYFEDMESKVVGRPLFIINFDPQPKQEVVECLANKKVRSQHHLPPVILDFLDDEKDNEDHSLYNQTNIKIFTEYKRNGVIYHAHPNFNSFGEWYDWAMITFEDDNGNNNFPVEEQIGYYANNLYPAKILCFVQGSDDSIHAVIHYCKANDHSKDSILVEHWEKEYKV